MKSKKKTNQKKSVSSGNKPKNTVKRVDVSGVDEISDTEFINSEGGDILFRKKLSKLCKEKDISVAVLEPGYFDKGVKRFGKERDGYAVVYDYDMMAEAIAEEYMKNSTDKDYTFEDAMVDANDWICVNTLRTIPYMRTNGMIAPIVVYTDENGKEKMA